MVESKTQSTTETDAEKQRRKLKETMESIERSKALLSHMKKVNEETADTMEKTKQQATKALVSAKKVVTRKERHIRKYEGEIKKAEEGPLDMIREDEDCDDY